MRRLIYFAVALTMLLASCAKDEATVADGEALVTFNVAAADMGTRVYGDGVAAHDLEYAIYEKGSYSQPLIQKEIAGAFPATTMSTAFTEKLVKGKTYVVLFWADAEQDPYTVNWNDQTVSITDPAALKSQDENLDAFFKAHEVSVGQDNQTEKIELRRPFAQLNIGTSDTEAAATAGLVVKQTEVAVSAYTTLNLMNGAVSNAMMLTYKLADIPSGENATFTVKEKVYDHLSMNYLLVDEKELIDVAFTVNDGSTNVNTANFAKVPVERNYKTFIIGELLTSPVNIDIIIIPDWMKPDHIYDGNIIVDQAEVETGKTGSDEVVTFTTKETWTAQVVAGAMRADESWCTVEPTSGDAGDAEITITTRPNDTGEDRSATVVIQAGESTQSITVTQYAVELPDEGEEENPVPNNEIWYTSTDGNIVMPTDWAYWNEATIISNTYEDNKGVITFDGDVTEIGDYAFQGCTSLKSITIPDSVTSIGDSAFQYCSLESITIPDSVTRIGQSAFNECNNLKAFYGKFATVDNRALIVNGVLNAFAAKCGATSYTIPNHVTEIEDFAFQYCSSLTSVTIPESVTSVGMYAFSYCTGLQSIIIPESVITIGWGAFYSCADLQSIILPNNLTEIGKRTFELCSSLQSINIPDCVLSIGEDAFKDCKNLSAFYGKFSSEDNRCLVIDGVLNAFAPMNVTDYTIPNDVEKIGNNVFRSCTNLSSITIPDNVTEIGPAAFSKCENLKNVVIGNNVTLIGQGAFEFCTSLTTIIIPESVRSIENWAFNQCCNLQSVYCKPTTPPSLHQGSYTFSGNAEDRKFYVPAKSYMAYIGADVWSRDYAKSIFIDTTSIEDEEDEETSCPTNEIWYTSTNGEIVIPYDSNVFGAKIVSNTYEDGKGIITFDSNVTSILVSAFFNCKSLQSIIIPKSVTKIGAYAFYHCSSLQSVYCKPLMPPTAPPGGYNMFGDNAPNRKIYVPEETVEIYKAVDGWTTYADSILAE